MKQVQKLLRIATALSCVLFLLATLVLPLSVFFSTDGGGTWASYGALVLALVQAFSPLLVLLLCLLLAAERYFAYRLGAISQKRLFCTVLILGLCALLALIAFFALLQHIDAANRGSLS